MTRSLNITLAFATMLCGLACAPPRDQFPAIADQPPAPTDSFAGALAGDEREVGGVKLCWCPAGRFRMGSPPREPERRPGEAQVDVTFSKGFWIGKYEVTQGQWKRVSGKLPGELTAELPAGDDFPVGNVELCRDGGILP